MKFYLYGRVDSDGVSEHLNQNIGDISPLSNREIASVAQLLPQRNALHRSNPEWLCDNSFDFVDHSYVVLTFIGNLKGFRNSIGYFIYDTHDPPKSVEHIDECYFIFPNCCDVSSGGALKRGDRMILAYQFTKNNLSDSDTSLNSYITPTGFIFPPGKSVGFILYSNGWKGSYINKYMKPFVSLSSHNPEQSKEHQYHTACIKMQDDSKLILGFEDMNRSLSSCEHDFNSVILVVDTEIAKLGKGFIDISDFAPSPSDPDMPTDYTIGYKKAFSTYNEKIVEVVITLYIPTDAILLRKKIYTSRYKTNKAYVKQIITVVPKTNIATTREYISLKLPNAYSWYNNSFVYTRGQYVTSDISDDDRTGIYYFKTFQEAEDYDFDPYKL